MNTETNEQRAFVESILERLRRQYVDRAPLPDREAAEWLSLEQLRRLYRYVLSEGYGE